jgi:hypothetical protein
MRWKVEFIRLGHYALELYPDADLFSEWPGRVLALFGYLCSINNMWSVSRIRHATLALPCSHSVDFQVMFIDQSIIS